MIINEMKLRRLSPSALFPPTIEGFFAVDGGLIIPSNSLKTWWPGTELNDSASRVFSNLLIPQRTERTRRTGKTAFVLRFVCGFSVKSIHSRSGYAVQRVGLVFHQRASDCPRKDTLAWAALPLVSPLTTFPDGKGKWRVSSNGAYYMAWSGNSKQLFYTALGRFFRLSGDPERIGESRSVRHSTCSTRL